jgi:PLP dependent protein
MAAAPFTGKSQQANPMPDANALGDLSKVSDGLQGVRARIAAALAAAGRDPGSVSLVAVSKTFPPEAIAAAVEAGQHAFGENYAQEGVEKIAATLALLRARGAHTPALTWHFIGPIQSNKTRLIAQHFDWVHSVDRLKVAQRLSDARSPAAGELQVCIQVNVSGESSKSGVLPAEVRDLARAVADLPRLRLRGLMSVPRESAEQAEQRAQFRMLRELRDALLQAGIAVDTLSMGMSEDLEAAIAEGATLVRVGRAIFGTRAPRAG